MPLWKDGSLFDSSSKNASNDEPQPSSDAGKKDDEGVSKESGINDQERPENSTQDVNTAGPSINTVSTNVNTGCLNINTVSPTVTTDRSNGSQTKLGMFSLGDNVTLEATHVAFFGDQTEVDMSNITTTYLVSSTPNTRIHKDHSLDHVIGDVQSGVQAKRMIKTTNEQGFISMDVKSAFLYGRIEEEVYVCQPLGFEDPDYPNKVYKVVKALYGLHQASRAWYETLAKYLLDNGFHRGKIDQTLFIKKQKGDILLVHVYVDDIIFGSTKKELCTEVASEAEEDRIFISQDKYDSDGDDVDVHLYRSMIGSLMYLTSSRPDFMYLKGQPNLGLWYPRDSSFDLVAYSDSDYARARLDRKSTIGGCQFLWCRLISWQCKKQIVVATSSTEAEYVAAASYCGQDKKGFRDNLPMVNAKFTPELGSPLKSFSSNEPMSASEPNKASGHRLY
ncbi:putative ribonuclease H-like domain-containing protein [Tanacetum coccineum]